MRSILISTFSIFQLLSTIHAAPQVIRETVPAPFPAPLHVGAYKVYNCHARETDVKAALDALYQALLPAIADVGKSPPSAAYQTFFKNSSYAPSVKSLLLNVSVEAAVSPGEQWREPQTPSIVCLSGRQQAQYTLHNNNTYDMYDGCSQSATSSVSILQGTPFIVLCPSFFNLTVQPAARTCLTTIPSNASFSGNSMEVVTSQIYGLLRELGHFYIYSRVGSDDMKVYSASVCSQLLPKKSVYNSQNYVYYVLSIISKCTDFPPAPSNFTDFGGLPDFLDFDFEQFLHSPPYQFMLDGLDDEEQHLQLAYASDVVSELRQVLLGNEVVFNVGPGVKISKVPA